MFGDIINPAPRPRIAAHADFIFGGIFANSLPIVYMFYFPHFSTRCRTDEWDQNNLFINHINSSL